MTFNMFRAFPWGRSNIEGESQTCQLYFRIARIIEKMVSAKGSLKFTAESNSFWEGTRREKTRLKKVTVFP